MRVATANSYDNTIANLTKRQAELSTLQDRISTGKRVQRASDDPVAAVLSEAAQNRLSRVEVDKRSIESSRTSLTQAESALGTAGELIQDVRDLLVAAGNGTYGVSEYKDIAQQIEGLRERLISVANQTDSTGRTLFGGLGGASKPFVEVYNPGGSVVQFEGLRGQEATGNNTLPQSFDGEAVFMRVPQGNGTFTLDLAAGNTGGVRTDMGTVSNPSALTGHDYSIAFADVGGVMEYTVTDLTAGTPVAGQTSVPYQSGATVEFDGQSFQMKGQPADGDSVNLSPATAPTDIFQVMQDAIVALRSATGSGSAPVNQAVTRSLGEIDAGHDRVLQARGQAGAWLNRADAIEGLLSDRAVAHEAERSSLEDLDMIQGISDFQNQQTGLQAALQSYAQVQRLSLFQYIG